MNYCTVQVSKVGYRRWCVGGRAVQAVQITGDGVLPDVIGGIPR